MEKQFKRDMLSLEEIFTFITDFSVAYQLDDAVQFSISLAVEELFTNMVKYNAQSTASISINLSFTGDQMIATLTDAESEPFDLTRAREPEVHRPLEERQPGGLGIHLAKQMVDELRYEHSNGNSIITLIKKVRRSYV